MGSSLTPPHISIRVDPGIYLPSDAGLHDPGHNLLIIRCLGDDERLPFSEGDAYVFESARKADKRAREWLGCRGFAVVMLIPMVAVATHLAGASPTFTTVVSAVFGSCGACLSMLFSGTFPDASSNAKNSEQNALINLQHRIEHVAAFSLKPEFRRQALPLLAKINVGRIKARLQKSVTQTLPGDFFRSLTEAVEWANLTLVRLSDVTAP